VTSKSCYFTVIYLWQEICVTQCASQSTGLQRHPALDILKETQHNSFANEPKSTAMSSKKRKASEEAVVNSDRVLDRTFPVPNLSTAQDSFYRHLYTKEVDFKSLSKQDVKFASVYDPCNSVSFRMCMVLTRWADSTRAANLISPTRLRLCNLPILFSRLTSGLRSSYLAIDSVLP